MVVIVTLACLYSLSFTFVTRKVERDAAAYAGGDIAKEKAYLDSIAGETVFNLGIAQYTYRECKAQELALGLDLKGGMNVTMEISLDELIKNLANNPKDEKFNTALTNAIQKSKSTNNSIVDLFIDEYKASGATSSLASFFATKDNAELIQANSSESAVRSFLQKEADNAIENSYKVLRTRIDKFGVASPNIQVQQGTNRILIELPGVNDETRVRKLLQGSAKLEFYETHNNVQIYPVLENINATLASVLKTSPKAVVTSTDSTKVDSTKNEDNLLANLGANKTNAESNDSTAALADLNAQNPLFSILMPSIYQGENGQQQLAPGAQVGIANLKDTARINSYFEKPEIASQIPANLKLMWAVKPEQSNPNFLALYAIRLASGETGSILTGDVITNASDDFDPQTNSPVVSMSMNTTGAREWRRITAKAAQGREAIAIVLDGVVYSAPSVNQEIPNGSSVISGNFTIEDTKDLANVLKAGRLPTTAKIVEEAIVGPSLGQAAIDAGVNSAVIGIVVVMIFMVLYYNRAGWAANIAVLFNVFFLLGVLASLNAVLTLPGIAGIVLTMGTAVDANVLIYERIREELRLGKSTRQAIADGYKHALPSILDSQITTFLVGVVLFFFGTGPILGFATTLMIGIITSLFTSIFISRLIFEYMLDKDMKINVSFPWSENTLVNANYQFIKKRKLFYIISTVAVLISLASIFTKGFTLGVDFQGGRTYTVAYDNAVNLEQVRENLDETFQSTTEVKTFGSTNQVRITTTYHITETSDEADAEVLAKLNEGLSKVSGNYEILSSQKVGPSIASDIKERAVMSAVISILIIAGYILIRFRKWQYSIGAAVATIHDAIILLGLFSILDGLVPFSLDIDQHFVAAMLTVIAYSVNDTVVVFDRLREYLNKPNALQTPFNSLINQAINSTLSRTIITSLTIIFVLAILFIFGGEVIRGFSFAILIGIVVGTYSSVILAAPTVYDLANGQHISKPEEVKV